MAASLCRSLAELPHCPLDLLPESTGGGRGMYTGRIFTRDGRLAAGIATIQETSRTFVLRAENGDFRASLPKRGLLDPALIPALGTCVREAVGTHPRTGSAATRQETGTS